MNRLGHGLLHASAVFLLTMALVGCTNEGDGDGDGDTGKPPVNLTIDTEGDTGEETDTGSDVDTDTGFDTDVDTDTTPKFSCTQDFDGACFIEGCGSLYDEVIIEDAVFSDCSDTKTCCRPKPVPDCAADLGGTCESSLLVCADGTSQYESAVGCAGDTMCCAPEPYSCELDFGGECKMSGDDSCHLSRKEVHTDCGVGYYCCFADGCVGETEPNDDATGAQAVEPPETMCAHFAKDSEPLDNDYFSFTLTEQKQIIIKVFDVAPSIMLTDKIFLYTGTFDPDNCDPSDPTNGCIAENDGFDQSVPGAFSSIVETLEAGTYYVRMSQSFDTSAGNYRVSVAEAECLTGGETMCDENMLKTCSDIGEWSIIDCSGTCVEIGGTLGCVNSITLPYNGVGETTVDSNVYVPVYYSFYVDAAARISLTLPETPGKQHIWLYSETFTPKASTDPFTCMFWDGCLGWDNALAPSILVDVPAAGTYYVRVEGQELYNNEVVGEYTINLQVADCDAEGDMECNTDGNLNICNDVGLFEEQLCLGSCGNRGDGAEACLGDANSCWEAHDLELEAYPFTMAISETNQSSGFESLVRCSGTATEDLWFSFVAGDTSQQITVSTTINSTHVKLFTGTCGTSTLTEVKCHGTYNWSLKELTFAADTLTIGNTYYLVVSNSSSAKTYVGGDITVNVGPVPTP